jgi:hypothetical protein
MVSSATVQRIPHAGSPAGYRTWSPAVMELSSLAADERRGLVMTPLCYPASSGVVGVLVCFSSRLFCYFLIFFLPCLFLFWYAPQILKAVGLAGTDWRSPQRPDAAALGSRWNVAGWCETWRCDGSGSPLLVLCGAGGAVVCLSVCRSVSCALSAACDDTDAELGWDWALRLLQASKGDLLGNQQSAVESPGSGLRLARARRGTPGPGPLPLSGRAGLPACKCAVLNVMLLQFVARHPSGQLHTVL